MCLALVIGLLAAGNTAASSHDQRNSPAGNSGDSHTLIPGLVLAGSAEFIYLMRPGGGVDALDTRDGTVRWTSDIADQPLFALGETLWCLEESESPGRLRLLPLDARTGALETTRHQAQVLPLPRGVRATMAQSPEYDFSISAMFVNGSHYLKWQYNEQHPFGTAPPPGQPYARAETGYFRFVEGRFESVESPPAAFRHADLPASLQAHPAIAGAQRPPWRTGATLAIAEQRYQPDQLVLRRWRLKSGEALPDRVLLQARAASVVLSCDGNFALVAQATRDNRSRQTYLLHVFAIDSGEQLASMPSRRSAGPFCLAGGHLLRSLPPYTQRVGKDMVSHPRELVALELASGRTLWQRALRDTRYRGSRPPFSQGARQSTSRSGTSPVRGLLRNRPVSLTGQAG